MVLNRFVGEVHRGFNVLDLLNTRRHMVLMLQFGFDVFGDGSIVTFDTGGTNTFEYGTLCLSWKNTWGSWWYLEVVFCADSQAR